MLSRAWVLDQQTGGVLKLSQMRQSGEPPRSALAARHQVPALGSLAFSAGLSLSLSALSSVSSLFRSDLSCRSHRSCLAQVDWVGSKAGSLLWG